MTKKKRIILIIIGVIIILGIGFWHWDQTRCYEIQTRCTPYDLSKIENLQDIDFYRGLNEKCMGKCGTAKLKLKFKKLMCRYKYKEYVNRTKDRRYFRPDTYNPCPELYTLPELNSYIKK